MQMVIIIIILLSLYIKHTFIYVSGGWLSLAKQEETTWLHPKVQ